MGFISFCNRGAHGQGSRNTEIDLFILQNYGSRSGNHHLVIKQTIGDFELRIGVFKIGDRRFKNTNPKFKITNFSFYHQFVISTFSSLLVQRNVCLG